MTAIEESNKHEKQQKKQQALITTKTQCLFIFFKTLNEKVEIALDWKSTETNVTCILPEKIRELSLLRISNKKTEKKGQSQKISVHFFKTNEFKVMKAIRYQLKSLNGFIYTLMQTHWEL